MNKNNYTSRIAAFIHVSESEVAMLYDDYSCEWEQEKLNRALWDLGLDTNFNFELQKVSQHRNRLNKVVTCARWYGVEREDTEWISCKWASQTVKDKLKNSKMLDDVYRSKGLTVDCIEAAEWKDKYNEVEE